MFSKLIIVDTSTVLAGPSVGTFFAELGATVISSGEASGNTSLTWYGGVLLVGGILAMISFIYRRVSASVDKK